MLSLPKPLLENYWWQERGACRGMDVRHFFYASNERGMKRVHREEQAKKVCASCPVIDLCREHALSAEAYGIWGGTTEAEREELRREQGGLRRAAS